MLAKDNSTSRTYLLIFNLLFRIVVVTPAQAVVAVIMQFRGVRFGVHGDER